MSSPRPYQERNEWNRDRRHFNNHNIPYASALFIPASAGGTEYDIRLFGKLIRPEYRNNTHEPIVEKPPTPKVEKPVTKQIDIHRASTPSTQPETKVVPKKDDIPSPQQKTKTLTVIKQSVPQIEPKAVIISKPPPPKTYNIKKMKVENTPPPAYNHRQPTRLSIRA